MNLKLWLAFGALLAAAHGARAGEPSRVPNPPDPADPSVAVPATVHASALTGYTPARQDGQPSPDKAWRPANDALIEQAPHAEHHAQAPAPGKDEGKQ